MLTVLSDLEKTHAHKHSVELYMIDVYCQRPKFNFKYLFMQVHRPKTKKKRKSRIKTEMKWKTNEFRKKSHNNAAVNSKHAILAVCLFTRCIHLFVQCAFSPSQMTAAIKMKIAIEWKMGAHGDKKCAAPPSRLPAATTAALNAAYIYMCVCVCFSQDHASERRGCPFFRWSPYIFIASPVVVTRRHDDRSVNAVIDCSLLIFYSVCPLPPLSLSSHHLFYQQCAKGITLPFFLIFFFNLSFLLSSLELSYALVYTPLHLTDNLLRRCANIFIIFCK